MPFMPPAQQNVLYGCMPTDNWGLAEIIAAGGRVTEDCAWAERMLCAPLGSVVILPYPECCERGAMLARDIQHEIVRKLR